jgi:hypothetical protein
LKRKQENYKCSLTLNGKTLRQKFSLYSTKIVCFILKTSRQNHLLPISEPLRSSRTALLKVCVMRHKLLNRNSSNYVQESSRTSTEKTTRRLQENRPSRLFRLQTKKLRRFRCTMKMSQHKSNEKKWTWLTECMSLRSKTNELKLIVRVS